MQITKSKGGRVTVAFPSGVQEFASMEEAANAIAAHAQELQSKVKSQAEITGAELKLNGKLLTISVDMTQRLGPTSSGKGTEVASTHGNRAFEVNGEKVYVSLNCYTKSPFKG